MFFDDYSKMLIDTMGMISNEDIQKLMDMIDEARENGRHVVVLGNGGSAAAASHWVCDFGKGINTETSKRLKIMAPVDNGAIFSALGNDCGYDTTFTEQMKNYLEPDDLVITLSVSGNSGNLIDAHKYAQKIGAKTACIVGDYNGKIIGLSNFAIVIPSKNYGVVEDLHIVLAHAISQAMRKKNEIA